MNWFKIIKNDEFRDSLMDCPKCDDGKLRLERHINPRGRSKSRGKLKCDRCGYEVIT